MGTRVAGMGTDARQISACASGSGINTGTGLSTTPSATENARLDGEGAESSCSDAAQQRSDSAWLTTRLDPSPSESDLCIGHAPSEQHAMRASGVAIQPAQTPSCPAETADTTTSTARRRQRSSTLLRMLDYREPVKQYNSVAPGRKEAAGAIPREKWQVRPWTREVCPRPGSSVTSRYGAARGANPLPSTVPSCLWSCAIVRLGQPSSARPAARASHVPGGRT